MSSYDASLRLGQVRGEGVPVPPRLPVRVLPSLRRRLSAPCPGCNKFSRTGRRLCDACWRARLAVIGDRLQTLTADGGQERKIR
jgi:hypothetical protein